MAVERERESYISNEKKWSFVWVGRSDTCNLINKKTKMEKGITLVALIVTIAVLVILVAVAINSIENDGIIDKAKEAATKYNESVRNEQTTLKSYNDILDDAKGSGSSGGSSSKTLKVGSYVEYDVSYTDMYQGKTYNSTNGWRYLGTDIYGNQLIISTAIPIRLDYFGTESEVSEKWWDNTATYTSLKATLGMQNNFDKIPYAQATVGTSVSTKNTAIGTFEGSTRTYNGTDYTAIGDYFKASTSYSYSSKIEKVRTLTLAELNKAVNSADGVSREEGDETSGFKDLTGDATGLFDMKDLSGYTADYYYWLATAYDYREGAIIYYVDSKYDDLARYEPSDYGLRPVVVLNSSVQLVDEDNDGRFEIR